MKEKLNIEKMTAASFFRFMYRSLIVAGIFNFVVAILIRSAAPLLYYSGMCVLLIAFIAYFATLYLSRAPVHSRGGRLDYESTPIRYKSFFIGMIFFCCCLIFSLLHALI